MRLASLQRWTAHLRIDITLHKHTHTSQQNNHAVSQSLKARGRFSSFAVFIKDRSSKIRHSTYIHQKIASLRWWSPLNNPINMSQIKFNVTIAVQDFILKQ